MRHVRSLAALATMLAVVCLHVEAAEMHVHAAPSAGHAHRLPALHHHETRDHHQHSPAHGVALSAPDHDAPPIATGLTPSSLGTRFVLSGVVTAVVTLAGVAPRRVRGAVIVPKTHDPPPADATQLRAPPQ